MAELVPLPERVPARDQVFSSLDSNLVRMLFAPYHIFTIHAMPCQSRGGGEAPSAFADRVARMLAAELRVPATTHSTADKKLWLAHVKGMGQTAYLQRRRSELHEKGA